MNQNVGASFGLSVLTVVFFAVALYQPDKPPPTLAASHGPSRVKAVEAAPPTASETPSRSTPKATADASTLAPGPKAPVVAARVAVRSRSDVDGRRTVGAPDVPRQRRAEPVRAAVARPVSRRSPLGVKPRESFTEARRGESLADVAHRVYGSADGANPLWLANRDILERADVALAAGTLLRTP